MPWKLSRIKLMSIRLLHSLTPHSVFVLIYCPLGLFCVVQCILYHTAIHFSYFPVLPPLKARIRCKKFGGDSRNPFDLAGVTDRAR